MKLLLALLATTLSATAIVWQEGSEPQTEQKEEMRNVGKLLYSPIKVLGGTCIALGDEWVLTSKHGTEKWQAAMLHVSFPALGKKVYAVEKIHLSPQGDLALLQLDKKVRRTKKITFAEGVEVLAQKVWLGGFGKSGPAKNSVLKGTFHGGYNRVEQDKGGKWVFTLSKKGEGEEQEATVAIMDSGSPLFVETPKGWQLCGIAATASNGKDPGYGDRSSYQKLEPHLKWLRETITD